MIAHLHYDRQTILHLHCYLYSKALHWDFWAKFCNPCDKYKGFFVGGKKMDPLSIHDEEKRF